jgi:sugar lactone lactonase YvrE
MATAECVLESACQLGEGPAWSPGEGALYWTDVTARRLHRWQPASGDHTKWDMPEMVTAVAIRQRGGLLIAAATGIDVFEPESGALRRFAAPEADRPDNRSNDGKCDRRGRFWHGTMMNNLDAQGGDLPITASTGALYRIDPDGSVARMVDGIGIANTLAWSPDDRTMYFADTLAGTIYAYDFDAAAGSIANRRVFARTDDHGLPDGSTIDAEGCLWNARWGGGCVLRWAPDGTIDQVVELPCRLVTSAIFGGPDLSVLYVTTVRHGLSEADLAEQPLAGGIFAIDAGVRGLPDGQFAG